MPEKAETTETAAPVAGDSTADRLLIVVFVISTLLGLGVLAWHYRASTTTEILCANAEAHCGDKADGTPQ